MIRRIFSILIVLFALLGFGWSPAWAAAGDYGSAFWGMILGNSWTYDFMSPGGGGTSREVVEIRDTSSFFVPTFVVNSYEGASLLDQTWYSVTLQNLKLWRVRSWDEDESGWAVYNFSTGITIGKNPIVTGDQWQESVSGSYTLGSQTITFSATVNSTVLNPEHVTTPQGTYLAKKIQNDIVLTTFLGTVYITEVHWFVPYLGFLKAEVNFDGEIETATLTSMGVKRWFKDFDGDGATDIGVYRGSWGAWFVNRSGGEAQIATGLGGADYDIPVPGDYDGDGKTDIAIFRADWGAWIINPSGGGAQIATGLGNLPNDVPTPGDYDGDGKTDIAIYRGDWGAYIINPSGGVPYITEPLDGVVSDIPVPGDYDGDGRTDAAIYRPSWGMWRIKLSGSGSEIETGLGGTASDIPIPGDYDGDGKTDIAIYRADWGAWIINPSGGGAQIATGLGGAFSDIPIPADYDGDGKTDIAIYRGDWGAWIYQPSGGGPLTAIGLGGGPTDIPLVLNPYYMD
jgi:hypothetical protein